MLLGLCLTIVASVGWGLAALVTRSAARTGRRDLERRFRQLHRDPHGVTFHDVENLLHSVSTPPETVSRVMGRAAALRLGARTMWRWATAHGVPRLVMVVDAGVAEDTLLEHLDAGTAPDWSSLSVFAGLANDLTPAGIPIDELVDLDVVPELEDLTFLEDLTDWSTASPDPLELRQFENLPPISAPGLSPFRPIASWDGDDWPDHDWPDVA